MKYISQNLKCEMEQFLKGINLMHLVAEFFKDLFSLEIYLIYIYFLVNC